MEILPKNQKRSRSHFVKKILDHNICHLFCKVILSISVWNVLENWVGGCNIPKSVLWHFLEKINAIIVRYFKIIRVKTCNWIWFYGTRFFMKDMCEVWDFEYKNFHSSKRTRSCSIIAIADPRWLSAYPIAICIHLTIPPAHTSLCYCRVPGTRRVIDDTGLQYRWLYVYSVQRWPPRRIYPYILVHTDKKPVPRNTFSISDWSGCRVCVFVCKSRMKHWKEKRRKKTWGKNLQYFHVRLCTCVYGCGAVVAAAPRRCVRIGMLLKIHIF